jgi:hypothetical protein
MKQPTVAETDTCEGVVILEKGDHYLRVFPQGVESVVQDSAA